MPSAYSGANRNVSTATAHHATSSGPAVCWPFVAVL